MDPVELSIEFSFHFIDKETVAWQGEVICLKSHTSDLQNQDLNPSTMAPESVFIQ